MYFWIISLINVFLLQDSPMKFGVIYFLLLIMTALPCKSSWKFCNEMPAPNLVFPLSKWQFIKKEASRNVPMENM